MVQDVATIDRTRQLAEGTARYVFMSTWLSWGIIFLLTAFMVSQFGKNHPRITLAALVGGSACMFLNLFWTGSRAENLLAVLPLFFVVNKIAPRHFRPFASVITVGIAGIVVFETIARTATMLNGGLDLLVQGGITPSQFVANQLAAVFDWQMGRYPTISLAFDMVNRYGHAFGSTLAPGPGHDGQRPSDFVAHPSEGARTRSDDGAGRAVHLSGSIDQWRRARNSC